MPPPNAEQAATLYSASEYLNLRGDAGRQLSGGCPQLNPDTAALAEFSTLMLPDAALCEGFLDMTNRLDQRWDMALDSLDPLAFQVVDGPLMLAGLFVLKDRSRPHHHFHRRRAGRTGSYVSSLKQ